MNNPDKWGSTVHMYSNLKDDEDSSDDEDDTAELMAELQRIKKERANERVRMVIFNLI